MLNENNFRHITTKISNETQEINHFFYACVGAGDTIFSTLLLALFIKQLGQLAIIPKQLIKKASKLTHIHKVKKNTRSHTQSLCFVHLM